MQRAKPRLEWRPQASADLVELVADIAEDNPDASQELKEGSGEQWNSQPA